MGTYLFSSDALGKEIVSLCIDLIPWILLNKKASIFIKWLKSNLHKRELAVLQEVMFPSSGVPSVSWMSPGETVFGTTKQGKSRTKTWMSQAGTTSSRGGQFLVFLYFSDSGEGCLFQLPFSVPLKAVF